MADREFAGLRCSDVGEASGVFVLGALEPEEADAIRRHLAECPEAHAEVAELGAVVPALFRAVEPVAPPDGLKARILAAAANDASATASDRTAAAALPALGDRPVTAGPPAAQRAVEPFPATDAGRRGRDLGLFFRRPAWAGVALAAVLGVVALGAWNLQLRDDLAALQAYRDGVVNVLEQAARPEAELAILTAPDDPAGPAGLAAIGPDGSVALVMRDLAPTAGTQVYETWLIAADGRPVPVGSFTVDASGTASFATASATGGSGLTVALTLEPRVGATTPTEPIIALGSAAPADS